MVDPLCPVSGLIDVREMMLARGPTDLGRFQDGFALSSDALVTSNSSTEEPQLPFALGFNPLGEIVHDNHNELYPIIWG